MARAVAKKAPARRTKRVVKEPVSAIPANADPVPSTAFEAAASVAKHYGPQHIIRFNLTSRADVKDENVEVEIRIG